jgi:hypothetical protein
MIFLQLPQKENFCAIELIRVEEDTTGETDET